MDRADQFDTFLRFLDYELELAEYAQKEAPAVKRRPDKEASTRLTEQVDGRESQG